MMVRSNILHLGEYIMTFLEVLMLIYFMMAKLQCWEARNNFVKGGRGPDGERTNCVRVDGTHCCR